MSNAPSIRQSSILAAARAQPLKGDTGGYAPFSESFGSHALRTFQIAAALGPDAPAFEAFVAGKAKLDAAVANKVGEIIVAWANKNGVTHYGHWFHPLTGLTAEKHDALLSRSGSTPNAPLERLLGSLLLQAEPDASSFPSGGLRATHEARGYTVWDPSSPIFIRADGGSRTLCIPSAYVSWKGHALDYKTPLLRALSAASREVAAFVNTVNGDERVTSVSGSLGCEQEYFVIDKSFAALRPDLAAAHRTLVGAPPARGQQLEDHYFGVIPARVQSFMADAESELFRLGVPVKTRHGEVAPAQYETAPIFEEINTAVDHNVLTMDVLRRAADRHGLQVLLHEKPFAGVNGSGKHNNWSLSTNEGRNLLEPGTDPSQNLQFLATLAAVFYAMDKHNDLVRAGIASAGNEHRLGANEAPPAIMSVYLGSALDAVVQTVADGQVKSVEQLADIHITDALAAKRELTDRNRTTPFAFTGNKFEFRAVGASENCAWPMTLLNAAVADAARTLKERILAKKGDRRTAVLEVVRETFKATARVRFEGNNYSQEWRLEAAKRGLSNHATTPAALAVLADDSRTGFLAELGILSREEIHSRHEIFLEKYAKQVLIEAHALLDLAVTQVAPAVQTHISRTGAAVATLAPRSTRLGRELDQLATRYDAFGTAVDELRKTTGEVGHDAHAIANRLRPAMAALRTEVDALEQLVADDLWPLPKYREMLFIGA
jgi:glutamine synthetase